MKIYTVSDVNRIGEAAFDFLKEFGHHRVLAFHGSMGAGKTTFIKALCNVIGVSDVVNSPSFAIVNEYSTPEGKCIYHFDFYRLKRVEEAMDMGYEDYFYSGNYCFVEWPEKIEELMPPHYLDIFIDVISDTERRIVVEER